MSEKVLLHICCAPCAIGAFEALSNEGFEVIGYFHNPNIHPLIEFRRRLKAVKVLRDRNMLKILCDEEYGLREYLRKVSGRDDNRCSACYEMRLDNACAKAKKLDINYVTTTLLGSPHQDVELIAGIGQERADKHGIKFLERDFRQFQESGDIRIFLISLRAGGFGLNLTAADYVFLLDPWWNPAVEEQALSRAHRIGQDKNVFVYRFIAKDSIEEKILKLQEKKSKLADLFISSNNPFSGISQEEVMDLFQ